MYGEAFALSKLISPSLSFRFVCKSHLIFTPRTGLYTCLLRGLYAPIRGVKNQVQEVHIFKKKLILFYISEPNLEMKGRVSTVRVPHPSSILCTLYGLCIPNHIFFSR